MYKSLIKIHYESSNSDEFKKIYSSRLNNENTIQLPLKIKNYTAFYIPTLEIISTLNKITQLNNDINEIYNKLPIVAREQKLFLDLLNKEFMIQDVISSNNIENIHSSRKEIEIAISSKNNDSNHKIQFSGFIEMYDELLKKDIKDKIINNISCEKIVEYYNKLLLHEIKDDDKPDGKLFRKDSVYVSNGIKNIHKGVIGEENIIDQLNLLLNFMKKEKNSGLIDISIFHYYFSYIHPFYDGNGRINRYLSSLFISDYLNKFVCLNLSSTINDHKKDYGKIFDDTNNTLNRGDLTIFITKFLEFILESCEDVKEKLLDYYHKLKYYFNLLNKINSNLKQSKTINKNMNSIIKILIQNALFENIGISEKKISSILSLSSNKFIDTIHKINNIGFKININKDKKNKTNLYSIDLESIETVYNNSNTK